MMTKVNLKTDNIIWISCSHTCANLIDAYQKIRDRYMEINHISQTDSDNAPFFLRRSGLAGLDLKNLRYRWKEAGYLNYREARDQNAMIQRLAGANAQLLAAHSEKTRTKHYFTATDSVTRQEMDKVFEYQLSRGLQTVVTETPMPEEDRLIEENLARGTEFLRWEKERKQMYAFTKSTLSSRTNKRLCRQAMVRIILGFECPFLSERFLLRSPLEFRKSVRKELNIHE